MSFSFLFFNICSYASVKSTKLISNSRCFAFTNSAIDVLLERHNPHNYSQITKFLGLGVIIFKPNKLIKNSDYFSVNDLSQYLIKKQFTTQRLEIPIFTIFRNSKY